MRDDPCFHCVLPECDDRDSRCAVRQLQRSYNNKVRRGARNQVTPAELEANCRIYDSWKQERMALASEGVRPFRKRGSPWLSDEGVRADG